MEVPPKRRASASAGHPGIVGQPLLPASKYSEHVNYRDRHRLIRLTIRKKATRVIWLLLATNSGIRSYESAQRTSVLDIFVFGTLIMHAAMISLCTLQS